MWMMMDTNSDPVIGRKLRPLMPRPIYSTPSCCCCCIPNPNMLSSWKHSINDHDGVVKREIQPLVSTRWNPTPEQLQALEEMYRRGIRTPSAEQIQQIAAKLRRFGKIEGKNVFYWFQNHKARERQKKRRQLELQLAGKKMHHAHQTPPAGLSRRYFEIEHHRKVPIPPSNCSTPSEDSASMHGAVIAAESGKDGWNHKELERCCWQLDYLSSSSSSISKATGRENTNCKPYGDEEEDVQQNQTTLDLFPSPTPRPQQQDIIPHTCTKITPTHFIEFLPIKN